MGFKETQVRQLRAKLDPKHIRTRSSNGASLSYVEGWHAIAEANRIFGYDAWDRRTVATNCIGAEVMDGHHYVAYTARVRLRVRAEQAIIVREGSGTGEAFAVTLGQAHELALKGAETDATKGALATFGNPFGLALYDREQAGVKKTRDASASLVDQRKKDSWVLRSVTGSSVGIHGKPNEFIEALRTAMSEVKDIELLYTLWEQNLETVRVLHRHTKGRQAIIQQLVAHLRGCAVALARSASNSGGHHEPEENIDKIRLRGPLDQRIDKSVLTIGESKRIRCKEHLRYVASQPCTVCGRSPSHAHHVRYAQSRGLSLKVSDEYTVPLCATHHEKIHTTGKERDWWQERGIDPLKVASELWQKTQARDAAARETAAAAPLDTPNG